MHSIPNSGQKIVFSGCLKQSFRIEYQCVLTDLNPWGISLLHCALWKPVSFKDCENRKQLPWEHLIGWQGVKLFLLKYVTITTVTTATVTTVTITTVPVWVFEFCHNLFSFSFVAIWVFQVLSQFFFLIFVKFDFFLVL